MNHREARALIEVREHLEMATCRFTAPEDRYMDIPGGWPARQDAFTTHVKEGTRVWRQTWVLPTLDELIERYAAPADLEAHKAKLSRLKEEVTA